jgi:hypothetical protein
VPAKRRVRQRMRLKRQGLGSCSNTAPGAAFNLPACRHVRVMRRLCEPATLSSVDGEGTTADVCTVHIAARAAAIVADDQQVTRRCHVRDLESPSIALSTRPGRRCIRRSNPSLAAAGHVGRACMLLICAMNGIITCCAPAPLMLCPCAIAGGRQAVIHQDTLILDVFARSCVLSVLVRNVAVTCKNFRYVARPLPTLGTLCLINSFTFSVCLVRT